MRKLKMPAQELNNFEDVFHIFEASQNAKGVSSTTLSNYKYSLKNISHYETAVAAGSAIPEAGTAKENIGKDKRIVNSGIVKYIMLLLELN